MQRNLSQLQVANGRRGLAINAVVIGLLFVFFLFIGNSIALAQNNSLSMAGERSSNFPDNPLALSTISLALEADSYVTSATPDTNFGSATRLYVDDPVEQSYIRFTVSGVTGTIQSAKLRLYVTNSSVDGPTAYGTDNTWSETGITWNNRPAPTTGSIGTLGSILTDTWVELDLTPGVTGNGTYNFVLLPDSTDGTTFYSRQGTNKPELVLTIDSGPAFTPTNTNTPTNTSTSTSTSTPTNTPTATSVPLSAPTLLSPLHPAFTNDTTPTLSWSSVTGASLYNLQVAVDTNFSSLVINQTQAPTTFTPSSPLAENVYFWRVRAVDQAGNPGAWSQFWSLTVDTTPPAAPALISPPNGVLTNDSSVGFDWGVVGDASTYHLQVSTNTAFSSPVIDFSQSGTHYSAVSLADGLYYWRVNATDLAMNTGGWSVVWTLTIDTTVPSTATYTSTSTPTASPTPTNTFTPSPTATSTQTNTPTSTNTPSPTATFTPPAPASSNPLFISFSGGGSVGGISFADEDILRFDGSFWYMYFDGSDVGVGGLDVFAFYWAGPNTLLLSFDKAITLNGVVIGPEDIARFDATSLGPTTAGTFSLYFDGSDVGFDTTSEKIDALEVLPDGRILISTTGNPAVTGLTGLADEDILAFTPTTLGDMTSGAWSIYFDGSDVDLATSSNEDIDALDVDDNGNIYLSTIGDFAVTNISGFDEDIFVCAPISLGNTTSCNFSYAMYFDGSTWGLSANDADAVHVLGVAAFPTATPSPVPTATNTPAPTMTPDPNSIVFVGAGDIADCSRSQDEATAKLLDNIPGTVYTVGDNAYPNGTLTEYNNCYGPTWGRHKARTYPAIGDNEYNTGTATGYFTYYGAAAGDPSKGYYSYDLGSWHIIVLNSNCSNIGGCGSSDPQGQWLQADLAAHPTTCTLAIFHEPLFSSSGGDIDMRDFWAPLYAAGADIILNGHRHNYERFALQNPDGAADPGRGIREFVVGTGGSSLSSFDFMAANSQVRNNNTNGVLKFTLHPTSYDWQFVPIAGQSFTDSGSAQCVTP